MRNVIFFPHHYFPFQNKRETFRSFRWPGTIYMILLVMNKFAWLNFMRRLKPHKHNHPENLKKTKESHRKQSERKRITIHVTFGAFFGSSFRDSCVQHRVFAVLLQYKCERKFYSSTLSNCMRPP